jgi:hypothetical protein
MKTVHLWRPRPRASRFGIRRHSRPQSRAARLLLACCLPLGTLGGITLLAGPAEAAPSTWSVTPSASPHGADALDGVSCAAAKFCMAVGSYDGGAGTLAEAWNGKSWSVTPSRSPGGDPDEFLAVSCTSSSFCMAVGQYGGGDRTLAEAWNGKSWSITPSRSTSVQSVLSGVSCTSSVSCEAVGQDDSSSGTLVERWNGKTWSITPSPRGGIDGALQGVTCRVAASCVAVGSHAGTSGTLTLVESWNGSRWSVVSSPSPGSGNNALSSVSCTGAARCSAVGYFSVSFGSDRTLAESWNGRRWSVVSTPDRTSRSNFLNGLSCVSSSSCVAAGYNVTGSGFGQTLIESWNGSRWSITPSPHPGADQQLLGVTCASATSCEATGYYGNGSLISDKTLVETGS